MRVKNIFYYHCFLDVEEHFEDRNFYRLNEDILHAAGGTWYDLPTEASILAVKPDFAQRVKETVKHAERDPLWGFKCPRTILTIEHYLPYLENPHFIACFRDADEVAKSLQLRNKMPLSEGIRLADEYNRRLIKFLSWWTNKESKHR